jgi:hypothetical protein
MLSISKLNMNEPIELRSVQHWPRFVFDDLDAQSLQQKIGLLRNEGFTLSFS